MLIIVNSTKNKSPNSILFLGLGGAGQRHLRCVKKLFPDAECFAYRFKSKTPLLNIDFSINKASTVQEKYAVKLINSYEAAKELQADLTVISTPTSSHAKLIKDFSRKNNKILVEKPAALNSKEADLIIDTVQNGSSINVCFQRFHDPAVKRFISIFKQQDISKLKGMNIKVGSDVRLWHPYEDYRDLYACRHDLGGGVLYTECHEIALVLKILGIPSQSHLIDYSMLNDSNVESKIEFDLLYEKIKVSFNLDFLSLDHSRIVTAVFDSIRIELDFLKRSLTLYNGNKLVEIEKFNEVSQDYLYKCQIKSLYEETISTSNGIDIIKSMATIFEQIKEKLITHDDTNDPEQR